MAISVSYVLAMTPVNVAELKNRLSHYLRLVRKGEVLLVRDRDRVIARIEPAGESDRRPSQDAERLADLEARGILRLGGAGSWDALLARALDLPPGADLVGAVLAEREEGR